MKLLNNLFSKKLPPLHFGSILIITYGRSGSTLLQGILNTIEGTVIRGENFNMCFHMFQTYQSILESKKIEGRISQNPFYGSELLNDAYFLNQTKETIRNLFMGKQNFMQANIRCYGFKEIRYWENLEVFPEFLDFLQKVFPKVAFVFNTRNKEDVVKSWLNVQLHDRDKKEEILTIIDHAESAFLEYIKNHKDNCFHIKYEDIIAKTEKLKSLFSFLGAPYTEHEIDKILSYRHSYKPNQGKVNQLPYPPPS